MKIDMMRSMTQTMMVGHKKEKLMLYCTTVFSTASVGTDSTTASVFSILMCVGSSLLDALSCIVGVATVSTGLATFPLV